MNKIAHLAAAAAALFAVAVPAIAMTPGKHRFNHKGHYRPAPGRAQRGVGVLYVANLTGWNESFYVDGRLSMTLAPGTAMEMEAWAGVHTIQAQITGTNDWGPSEPDVVVAGYFSDVDIIP
jgi:hypothetical protein